MPFEVQSLHLTFPSNKRLVLPIVAQRHGKRLTSGVQEYLRNKYRISIDRIRSGIVAVAGTTIRIGGASPP